MSSKIGFICVVFLAISFVVSKLKDKSNEDVEGVDGYIDTFFDVVFEDDSSEEKTDLAFGPDFEPDQFLALINADIVKSYRRKCKKISGSDDTYDNIKVATRELGVCLKSFVKSQEIKTAYTNLNSEEDIHSFIRTLCRNRDVPLRCVDNFMAIDSQCSFPREIAIETTIRRVFGDLLDLACANDANDYISMITGPGRQCLVDNKKELKTCAFKELYAIVRGIIVKFIEYETFEFKMNEEDCGALKEVRSCYVTAVENCVDPIFGRYVNSYYGIIRNETSCSKNAFPQTNLLN